MSSSLSSSGRVSRFHHRTDSLQQSFFPEHQTLVFRKRSDECEDWFLPYYGEERLPPPHHISPQDLRKNISAAYPNHIGSGLAAA